MSRYKLTTEDLASFMLKDPFINRKFGGILALDQLYKAVFEPKIYIVNTDTQNGPGQHWFCIYLCDYPEHFDPAGLEPMPYVRTFLTARGSQFMYNSKRVQSFSSETCGVFCLFFAFFRCRNYSFRNILSMFSNDLHLNEIIVKQFFESYK